MKHLLLLSCLLLAVAGTAQITVPTSSNPAPGDTLYTAVDNLPSGLDLLGTGGPKQWNFSSLQAPFSRETLVLEASEGSAFSSFTNASYMANIMGLGEAYFREKSDRIELLGYFGEDPQGLGIEILTKFEPPSVEKWAPLQYQDSHNTETDFSFAFDADDLPDVITDSLGLPAIDSMRVRINAKVAFLVDAWGTMTIPGGSYDVLREKRTTIQQAAIDVKFGFGGWLDLSSILGADNPLFQPDTSTSYLFFNDVAKEPIAVANMDSTGEEIVRVEFKSAKVLSSVQKTNNLRPGVYAYPNPAISYIRFDFSGLNPGSYTLRIYNILGQEVWQNSYRINDDMTDRVSLSGFKKGTYLYSLQDGRGNTLLTRRFIILRP